MSRAVTPARSIDEWSSAIAVAWQKSTAAILETGRLLIEAKAELAEHGTWMTLVDRHLPFGQSTVNKLMAIAGNPVLANSAHVPNLPPSWGTLYELTKLPEPKLRAKIADGTINPRTERTDVAKLRGHCNPEKRPRAVSNPTPKPQPEAIQATAEAEHTEDTYVGRDPEWDALSECSGLQRGWDATSAEAKQQFVAANIVELTALVAHHRKQHASAVADRAIECNAPRPPAPIADFPDMPAFLDRTAKPN
jgi:hypothetical protein